MRTLRSWAMACAMVLVTSQICAESCFSIYDWSARDFALGGATVGRADDPAALATNPAGITQLDGLQLMTGVMAIHPVMDVVANGEKKTSDTSAWYFPPHLYATWQVNDRYTLGLGTFSRFGLGTKFDDNWQGRYSSYEALIESVSINPNMAVKVTDQLSAAFGVEAMYLNFSQKKKLPMVGTGGPTGFDGNAHLEADGLGYGFNMALHYQPCPYAKLGLTYRSPVTMKVTGDAKFSDINPGISAGGFFRDSNAHGTVTLPDSFAFGVAMYPMDKLSVEFGAVYTLWSKYDELTINFGSPLLTSAGPTMQTSSKKNWNDVWRLNVGLEYSVLDCLDLRLGYVFDQTPVPSGTIDYMLPDSDRHVFNSGAGFHWDNWNVDLNYSYILFTDRDIDGRPADFIYDGEVKNAGAHVIGLSVGYKF